jgi:sulfur-carrier protein
MVETMTETGSIDVVNTPITLLYFGALAESLQCQEEQILVPEDIATVGELRSWLAARSQKWSPLTDTLLLCAVNQEVVPFTHLIQGAEEIAFFPPVTGG